MSEREHHPPGYPLRPALVRAPDSRFGEQVFVCLGGRRHLVIDAGRLDSYGIAWPRDLVHVSPEFLESLRPAQFLPRRWTAAERARPPSGLTSRDLREIAAAHLTGLGLEVGALASPYPAPIDCQVLYGDILSHAELVAEYTNEPRDNMVIPTIRTSFETLTEFSPASLDFILASHVIEHTRDPIGAVVNALAKLRDGGTLVLVIPDKRRTFDRNRPVTPLEHLIADFRDPSHERDADDHREFHRLAFPRPDADYEAVWRHSWNTRRPIHYHTWVYDSFMEMIRWIAGNAASCRGIWSHPTLHREVDDFEFYVTLTK